MTPPAPVQLHSSAGVARSEAKTRNLTQEAHAARLNVHDEQFGSVMAELAAVRADLSFVKNLMIRLASLPVFQMSQTLAENTGEQPNAPAPMAVSLIAAVLTLVLPELLKRRSRSGASVPPPSS